MYWLQPEGRVAEDQKLTRLVYTDNPISKYKNPQVEQWSVDLVRKVLVVMPTSHIGEPGFRAQFWFQLPVGVDPGGSDNGTASEPASPEGELDQVSGSWLLPGPATVTRDIQDAMPLKQISY